MKSALIVVDFQRDFCPGGSLPVPGGNEIIFPLSKLVMNKKFEHIVFSHDWHPEDHSSFKTWPKHCVQNTYGSKLAFNFYDNEKLIFTYKGKYKDTEEYSAFNSTIDMLDENLMLDDFLKEKEIGHVYVCGLALDYCVGSTALDFVKNGYKTTLILDACRGISDETMTSKLKIMLDAGVKVIYSENLEV
ncbi:isochorismatase family protein [Candidatus Pacearchaeota archaeon]|jgi:nicotinamidase/pyrazinamidase|nr:isochorismatase family protein [bacterium]MCK9597045.1 isochorismatase family protein [Candidatus Pacearchaeota archaeon]